MSSIIWLTPEEAARRLESMRLTTKDYSRGGASLLERCLKITLDAMAQYLLEKNRRISCPVPFNKASGLPSLPTFFTDLEAISVWDKLKEHDRPLSLGNRLALREDVVMGIADVIRFLRGMPFERSDEIACRTCFEEVRVESHDYRGWIKESAQIEIKEGNDGWEVAKKAMVSTNFGMFVCVHMLRGLVENDTRMDNAHRYSRYEFEQVSDWDVTLGWNDPPTLSVRPPTTT